MKTLLPVALLLVAVAACQPPAAQRGPGTPGPEKANGLNPEACGDISKHDVGRKAHAFLVASAELDRASLELEGTVHKACEAMATEMLISTDGDTKTLCDRVNKELESSLEVSISQEQRLVTRTVPPVCTTEIGFTADIVAECEAKLVADVSVRCEGQCGAVCNGACDGECSATAADGSCAGTCSGVCQGSCTGTCEGSAYVDASAECKASAEIRASVHTECTEATVEVVTENVTVVDASRLERAVKAIKVGLPILLQVGAKAKLIAKSFVHWSKTAVSLAGASGRLFKDLGARGVCVGVQLAAAVAASANISARVEVSIEVSASVSASAGSES